MHKGRVQLVDALQPALRVVNLEMRTLIGMRLGQHIEAARQPGLSTSEVKELSFLHFIPYLVLDQVYAPASSHD